MQTLESLGLQSVSDEEAEAAFDGPAPFTNKVYVTASGPVARLAFCEQRLNGKPVLRAAVTISLGDLLKLQEVIQKLSATFKKVEISGDGQDG